MRSQRDFWRGIVPIAAFTAYACSGNGTTEQPTVDPAFAGSTASAGQTGNAGSSAGASGTTGSPRGNTPSNATSAPKPSAAGSTGGSAGTAATPGAMGSAAAATSPGAGMSGAGTGATAGTGAAAALGGASAPDPMAVACDPADKTPEPTPASFTQIGGYESLTKEPTTGPLKPVLESDPGLADWTVYRPEALSAETKHGILVWANGGCLQNGTLYGQWLLELASHGYIAIADGAPQEAGADPAAGGQRGFGADGAPQSMAIDWITAENDRPCSQYYRKVDVTKIAVAGQSCGGLMALGAAGDERVTTALIFNSGLLSPDEAVYAKLHTPIGYFIGGSTDSAYQNSASDYAEIDNIPLFLGNLDVGHGATWEETNAGEFGRVGLGWLNWQLRGDIAAEKMFKGADCELCKPPSEWVVMKKMID